MKLKDHYLIHIPRKHETEFVHGSLTLLRPVISVRMANEQRASYNPDEHLSKEGAVVLVPGMVSSELTMGVESDISGMSEFDKGFERSLIETNRAMGAAIQLQVGDIAYFYHHAPNYDMPLGKEQYNVHMRSIVAYKRNDVVYVTQGHVMILPVPKYEHKTAAGIIIPSMNSKRHVVDTDGWWKETSVEYTVEQYEENHGTILIAHAESEMSVGDHIIHRRNADYPLSIDGKQVFVVKETDVLCVVG